MTLLPKLHSAILPNTSITRPQLFGYLDSLSTYLCNIQRRTSPYHNNPMGSNLPCMSCSAPRLKLLFAKRFISNLDAADAERSVL